MSFIKLKRGSEAPKPPTSKPQFITFPRLKSKKLVAQKEVSDNSEVLQSVVQEEDEDSGVAESRDQEQSENENDTCYENEINEVTIQKESDHEISIPDYSVSIK